MIDKLKLLEFIENYETSQRLFVWYSHLARGGHGNDFILITIDHHDKLNLGYTVYVRVMAEMLIILNKDQQDIMLSLSKDEYNNIIRKIEDHNNSSIDELTNGAVKYRV